MTVNNNASLGALYAYLACRMREILRDPTDEKLAAWCQRFDTITAMCTDIEIDDVGGTNAGQLNDLGKTPTRKRGA